MKIEKVLFSPGLGGYYFMDVNAIRAGAVRDGFTYRGKPVREGFSKIVQQGESVSVMLITDTKELAFGDCVAIAYSSNAGRPKPFIANNFINFLKREIAPRLLGKELTHFKDLSEEFDQIRIGNDKLHPGIRYGVSQALLDGVSKARRVTMTEVLAQEFGLQPSNKPIPILSSVSAEQIYEGVDKSIIKSVEIFPHHAINTLDILGTHGENLLEFLAWMRKRTQELGEEGYTPSFHIDVYGTIGTAFNWNIEAISDYLGELENISRPYQLYIESVVEMKSREEQVEVLGGLTRTLEKKGINVTLIVDEWCNSLDDIYAFLDAKAVKMIQIKMPLYGGLHNGLKALSLCKEKGVMAYIGGSCNETDKSVQVTVHVALAGKADWILARPGLGVDEGIMIVHNEMQRTLALMASMPNEK
jgi:methylaspartate ammonia-lyase